MTSSRFSWRHCSLQRQSRLDRRLLNRWTLNGSERCDVIVFFADSWRNAVPRRWIISECSCDVITSQWMCDVITSRETTAIVYIDNTWMGWISLHCGSAWHIVLCVHIVFLAKNITSFQIIMNFVQKCKYISPVVLKYPRLLTADIFRLIIANQTWFW